MVCVAKGKFREFRELTSKKGNKFFLLELGADDYRAVTLFVPENKVSVVNSFRDGDNVAVQFTLESRMSGLNATLIDIEKK